MSAIYILSDQANSGRYKVGSHRGSLKQLRSRYITALPNLQIHYFIQTPHAKIVEESFKRQYSQFRVDNSNGNPSEWFALPLDNIIVGISMLLMQCLVKIEEGVAVYTHNQMMEIIQSQIQNAFRSQDHSGVLSKLQSENEQLKSRLDKVRTLESENKQLRAEIARLNANVSSVSTNLSNLQQQVQPTLERQKQVDQLKLKLLDQFIKENYRPVGQGGVRAKEFNDKLFTYSLQRKNPIASVEVKSLMEALGNKQHKGTNGWAYYRFEEVRPVQVEFSQPKVSPSSSPMSSPGSPSGFSPAPIYNSGVQMPTLGASLKR